MNKKLNKIWDLVNKIKNDITIPILSDFLDWVYEKLNIHFFRNVRYFVPKQWDIFYVKLWYNIWSELNKTRPCIVISKRKFNTWWTVIVVPLKSYKWKDKKYFIKIQSSKNNKLWKDSLVDIFAIRQVDKKRLLNRIWSLEKEYVDEINILLRKIL